jgi:cytochrome c biogenesis protein ResB
MGRVFLVLWFVLVLMLFSFIMCSLYRVIKNLCAPVYYNTKQNKQNYFKQFQSLTVKT